MTLSKYHRHSGIPQRRGKKQIFSLIILLGLFIFSIYPVFAQGNLTNAGENLGKFGKDSGYDTTNVDIDIVIGNIIQYFLSFLGVIFLTLMIYAGYLWMQARGDTEAVQQAKDTMKNAGIGLAFVLGAWLLSSWIVIYLSRTTLKN